MVRLGPRRVYFTAHFLDDESEFLARERFAVDGVHEVFAMLAETYLLLIDVELLEVVDHFFLKSALVRFQHEFGDGFLYFRPYCGDSFSVERFHLIFEFENVVHSACNVLVQSDSLA